MVNTDIVKLLSLDNPVMRAYLFYNSMLVLKMMCVTVLTARQRFAKNVFISPEDAKLNKGGKVNNDDPDVERVRRAHRNDMENILIYFVAAFGYLLTNPEPDFAIMLMRIFTIARIVHTFVYAVVVVPQPTRGIAFFFGFFVTGYMALVPIFMFGPEMCFILRYIDGLVRSFGH